MLLRPSKELASKRPARSGAALACLPVPSQAPQGPMLVLQAPALLAWERSWFAQQGSVRAGLLPPTVLCSQVSGLR